MMRRQKSWMGSWENGGHILILGVKKEYRRQGIAKLLVDQVFAKSAEKQKCYVIYLHTLSTNVPAIQFYTKYGFSPSSPILFVPLFFRIRSSFPNTRLSSRRRYYTFPDRSLKDAILFVLELDKPPVRCVIL
jgi:predicted acetyltransferase